MAATPAFDFAFIDADKAGYPEYYELVLAADAPRRADPARQHAAGRPGADAARPRTRGSIDELNRRIHADERVDMAMTISADGLTFARVR